MLFERLRFRERFGEISIPRAEHVDEGFLIVTGKVSVLYGQTVVGFGKYNTYQPPRAVYERLNS